MPDDGSCFRFFLRSLRLDRLIGNELPRGNGPRLWRGRVVHTSDFPLRGTLYFARYRAL